MFLYFLLYITECALIRQFIITDLMNPSYFVSLSISVVEQEKSAAAKALEFSIEVGFDSIILEGDSEIVMKVLMDDFPSLASFGLLIRDVKTYAK